VAVLGSFFNRGYGFALIRHSNLEIIDGLVLLAITGEPRLVLDD
jgi:hypothetical protein